MRGMKTMRCENCVGLFAALLIGSQVIAEPCEPTWHPFTAGGQIGVSGVYVSALTVWNSDLIVGGWFTTAGGKTVNYIARWDGSAWHPFTSGGEIGVNGGAVVALTVWNDDLIAGGYFTTAGGQTVNRIARWDGSAWHPFTSGGQIGVDDTVTYGSLTVYNGDLIAGGWFTMAGGQTVNGIARWDGSAWHPFASGGQTGIDQTPVWRLRVWNGDLIAAGAFTTAGGQTVNRIARWDASAWHPFTSGEQIGVNNWIGTLTELNGDLIAGGAFTTAGGQTVNRIARWDGSAWHPVTSGGQIGVNDPVRALTVWNGDQIAGGSFTTAGGQTVNRIARLVAPVPSGPADLNCDGTVGVADLLILLAAWGDCADCNDCPADLTGSCTVGVADLLILLANWG